MAAPSYTTDLTTIATGDINVDVGTWDESTDAGWDTGGTMVDDENLYYNNTECVSAQLTKDANGTGAAGPATIFYNHTSNITIPTNGAALIHHLWAAPPALNTIDNATSAGINICMGSGLGDFYAWKASGSDFEPAPRGGWTNYAINPAIGSPDHTVGTAPTTYSMVGIGVSATAQARGNPNACNAVRYGRCTSIFTLGDEANGYATFSGFGAVDNATTARWNLLEPIGTSGFRFQGLMSLGLTATAVDFRDANKAINIKDTINVTSAFNRIEIHHASSNIEWDAIGFTALGTNSKGEFEMIDNATVTFDSCTFTDMSTFIFQSNADIASTTFRRCGQITLGGGTLDKCVITNSTSASSVVATSTSLITNSTFESDGSNHAINLGTISSDTSMAWNNTLVGYAASNGSTGNEALLVNVASGQTLTINMTGGTSPTYYNTGTGTVTVSASVTVEVKNVISGSSVHLATIDGNGDESTIILNETASGTTASTAVNFSGLDYTSVTIAVRNSSGTPRYLPYRSNDTISAGGLSHSANQQEDSLAS